MSTNISIYDEIIQQISKIDTSDLPDNVDSNPELKIVEEQKVYFWIRLFLKEENPNIEIGDDITIKYIPNGEELKTKFICYSKKGLEKNHADQVIGYNQEDDRRILCLMIDINKVNNNDDIPFIRTMFKSGIHFEYQLVKRDDMQFIIDRNGMILDYFDCNWG